MSVRRLGKWKFLENRRSFLIRYSEDFDHNTLLNRMIPWWESLSRRALLVAEILPGREGMGVSRRLLQASTMRWWGLKEPPLQGAIGTPEGHMNFRWLQRVHLVLTVVQRIHGTAQVSTGSRVLCSEWDLAEKVEGGLCSQGQSSGASRVRPWASGFPEQEQGPWPVTVQRIVIYQDSSRGIPDLTKAGTCLLEMRHKWVDVILSIRIKQWPLFRTGSEEYYAERCTMRYCHT